MFLHWKNIKIKKSFNKNKVTFIYYLVLYNNCGKKTTSINILKKDIVKKIKKFIQIRPLNICLNYNSPFDKILEEQYPYTHPTNNIKPITFLF